MKFSRRTRKALASTTTRAYTLVVSSDEHYQPSLTFLAFEKLFNVVYYSHFAVNIVLYATLGGSNFRSTPRRCCHAFYHPVAHPPRRLFRAAETR